MSLNQVRTAFAVLCGLGLLAVSLVLAHSAFWFRIDTPEDRAIIWEWDIFLGLMFAAVVLLLGGQRSTLTTFGQVAVTWVFVSASFLLWHEVQVSIRWRVPRRLLALNRVRLAQVALLDYARDCGGFPPEDKGLAALRTNPGVAGWAGPYIEAEDLTDPWGNVLEYRLHGDRAAVWSNGPDGKSGTEDDIHMDDPGDDRLEP
jgi:hypothetical protein